MRGNEICHWIYFGFIAQKCQENRPHRIPRNEIYKLLCEEHYQLIYVVKNTTGNLFQYVHNLWTMWICQYIPWSQTKQHSNESFLHIPPKINLSERQTKIYFTLKEISSSQFIKGAVICLAKKR